MFGLAMTGAGLLLPAGSSGMQIHAHRGGPNVEGEAMFGENSMSAFRHSAEAGFVVEFDLAQTSDGVAVAMHDDSLDRTTDCDGDVSDFTWAELDTCRIDRIGIGDVRQDLEVGDPRLEAIPRLSQIIDLLKETGAKANIEVKNPGGASPVFPHAVYTELAASGLSASQVILQNFKSGNLKDAASIYPGVVTSQLCLSLSEELDQLSVDIAAKNGSAWISPQWPFPATFMSRAREAGLMVVPWTIDDPAELFAAAEFGVDAVITNDPTLADRLIGPKPALSLGANPVNIRTRPGRLVRFRVRIRNAGEAASGPVRLAARSSTPAVITVRPTQRLVAEVAAGSSVTRRFNFRVRAGARAGSRSRVTFRLAGAEGSTVALTRTIRVKRAPVRR